MCCTINEILTNKTKEKAPIRAICDSNIVAQSDGNKIAEIFNLLFRDVGKNLFDKISDPIESLPNTTIQSQHNRASSKNNLRRS